MRGEAVVNCLGATAVQNLIKRLLLQIPKCQISILIHTARNDASVNQDTDLISQAEAEALLSHIFCRGIGPIEIASPFKIHAICNLISASVLFPFTRKSVFQAGKHLVISILSASVQIPKTKSTAAAVLSALFCKRNTVVQIFCKIHPIVCLKGMQRNTDLMDARAQNTVTAPIYPTANTRFSPAIYTYEYLRGELRTDENYQGTEVMINTPYCHVMKEFGWLVVNYSTNTIYADCEATDSGYRYVPENDRNANHIVFTLSESDDPKHHSALGDIIIFFMLALIFYYIVMPIGIIIIAVVVIRLIIDAVRKRRAKKQDGDGQ